MMGLPMKVIGATDFVTDMVTGHN